MMQEGYCDLCNNSHSTAARFTFGSFYMNMSVPPVLLYPAALVPRNHREVQPIPWERSSQ
jgi:hypothetical protein